MNCEECTHYHDLGDKLMCDAGIMEVLMIGNPRLKIVAEMPQCERFQIIQEIENMNVKEAVAFLALASDQSKIDRRTKEYKEKHK